MRGKQATTADAREACSGCGAHTLRRKWLFACVTCPLLRCSRCAWTNNPVPTQASIAPSAAHGPRPAPEDPAQLLEQLRALPRAYSSPPALWVPRSVRQQVAAELRSLLSQATRLLDQPMTQEAELAQLLLYHAPQLLLRSPSRVGHAATEAGHLQTAVRNRVAHARMGRWNVLATELQADLDEAAAQRDPSGPAPQVGPDEPLSAQRAQAATLRARAGALRSASNILTGRPPVPPGPDTDRQIEALFLTGAWSDDETASYRSAYAWARALPQEACAQISLRGVDQQVRAAKPSAGTGPSGWRNSYIHLVYSDVAGPIALLRGL